MNYKTYYTSIKTFFAKLWLDFKLSIRQVSIDGIGWTALIALHAVTVPSLFGLMTGLTDNTPSIDMVIILWSAMALFYIKSILEKNVVSVVIIGLGFVMQSILMALVFFKQRVTKEPKKTNTAKGRESFDITVGNSLVSFLNRNVTSYPTEVGAPKFDLVPVTKQKDIMINVARLHASQEYDRIMELVNVLQKQAEQIQRRLQLTDMVHGAEYKFQLYHKSIS